RGQDHVHDAELLVVHAGEPLAPQVAPLLVLGDGRQNGDADHRHDGKRDQKNVAFGVVGQEGQRIERETPEQEIPYVGTMRHGLNPGKADQCAAASDVAAFLFEADGVTMTSWPCSAMAAASLPCLPLPAICM